jgi:hypothetical protein
VNTLCAAVFQSIIPIPVSIENKPVLVLTTLPYRHFSGYRLPCSQPLSPIPFTDSR